MYKGTTIRLLAEFSLAGTSQDKRQKGKSCNQEYTIKLGYHTELNERQSFPDKQNLEEFITTKPDLKEMLKGLL